MTNQLVFARNGQPVTTSIVLAENTDNTHQAILRLLNKYRKDFEFFGRVGFEIQPFETEGGTQRRQIAFLNEQQATLLVTYCKNTEIVRKFKVILVKAFYDMRQQLMLSTTEESSGVATLTPAQQLAIQQAVGRRAQKTANHYQTIYRAIKLRYQIARYDQLPQDKFEDCLMFIDEMELHVPETVQKEDPLSLVKEEPKQRYAVINSDEVIVKKDSVMKLLNEAERTLDQIRGLESHLMGCVHEVIFRIELSRNA